jgi:hypothetical protein
MVLKEELGTLPWRVKVGWGLGCSRLGAQSVPRGPSTEGDMALSLGRPSVRDTHLPMT